MNITDIEIGIVLLVLAIFFITGIRKKNNFSTSKYCGIDLQMSTVIKGVACVLILLGHFVKRRYTFIEPSQFTILVYYTSTNVALALFMYISGYGLSVKKQNGGGILPVWIRRLKKVYLPLLLTCVFAMILYAILPVKYTLEESLVLSVPKDIWYIHHLSQKSLGVLLPHFVGWKDWYVFCIIIFYSLFYLSLSITSKRSENQTWVLWLMLVLYYVCAYFYFGKTEAHWYRYCWAFFIGHVHGKMVQSERFNKWDLLMILGLCITTIVESKYMILSYILAVSIMVICTLVNRKYVVNSRVLIFIGTISYFFYLSHVRIGYTLMCYTNVYSILLWLLITITISFVLNELKTNYLDNTKRCKSNVNNNPN